jgi:hypothetical protein
LLSVREGAARLLSAGMNGKKDSRKHDDEDGRLSQQQELTFKCRLICINDILLHEGRFG